QPVRWYQDDAAANEVVRRPRPYPVAVHDQLAAVERALTGEHVEEPVLPLPVQGGHAQDLAGPQSETHSLEVLAGGHVAGFEHHGPGRHLAGPAPRAALLRDDLAEHGLYEP